MKAASLLGSKLGGELVAATKQAHLNGATVVLGDRLYSVTIQRVFDKLRFFERLRVGLALLWEVLFMSMFRLKVLSAFSNL